MYTGYYDKTKKTEYMEYNGWYLPTLQTLSSQDLSVLKTIKLFVYICAQTTWEILQTKIPLRLQLSDTKELFPLACGGQVSGQTNGSAISWPALLALQEFPVGGNLQLQGQLCIHQCLHNTEQTNKIVCGHQSCQAAMQRNMKTRSTKAFNVISKYITRIRNVRNM